jgi:hypothetical protein
MGWSLDAAAMQDIEAIVQRHITDPAGEQFMASPQRPARRPAA